MNCWRRSSPVGGHQRVSRRGAVELTVLRRRSIVARLREYLEGKMSAIELEVWANAIEVREGIGREPGQEALISEFILSTSNPSLSDGISRSYVEHWIERFDGAEPKRGRAE
jgi:hypothetical protein